MKHFTKIADISKKELLEILDLARELQDKKEKDGFLPPLLKGKNMVLIFEKPSLRTHISFDFAMSDLGGHSIFFGKHDIFIDACDKERESLYDVIKNLEKFADIITARVFGHKTIEEMQQISVVPIINALSDLHHPTQALCDLYAIKKHFEKLAGLKVAWIGDGNNVATSLAQICDLAGMQFAISAPKGFEIPKSEKANLKNYSEFASPTDAVKDADVVVTDTWVSMGQETEKEQRKKIFLPFQVNKNLMSKAKKDAIFMHCLPAHRNFEVTTDVIDGPKSIVFDQAVARMYIARALLVKLFS